MAFQAQAVEWQGLPAIALRLNHGDSCLVSLQGAQVLSWISQDQERLFLSPLAAHDGKTAIRGGIPVCFPQFNQRGPLVKHGFARLMTWTADEAQALGHDGAQLKLRLKDTEATRAVWPHEFEAVLTVQLTPAQLRVELAVNNLGEQDLSFTAALHSYLRVPDVEQAALQGLQDLTYWDAVADTHPQQQAAVLFGVETDRVYPRAGMPLSLQAGEQPWLQIAQDAAWRETVVWNPGPALCASLKDMEPSSWQQMLCVEAAAIDDLVTVPSGQRWQAAQTLRSC